MRVRLTTREFIKRAKIIHGEKYNYSKVFYIKSALKVKIICKEHGIFEQTPNNHLQGKGCKKCAMETLLENQKVTEKDFLNKLEKYSIKFSYKVISEYVEYDSKLLIDTVLGKCLMLPKDLIKGCKPSIKSAVNKTKYFKNQAESIHGNKYNYSLIDYKGYNIKLNINCNIHGDFLQSPHHHLSGHGCSKCASNICGWSYTNWEEAGKRSKDFDSFKVYIIKCWNENEEFYKIGKTFRKVKERFRGQKITKTLPYNYEIIKVFEGKAREISELETKLQKDNKQFKYIPKISFGGKYECFNKLTNNYDL